MMGVFAGNSEVKSLNKENAFLGGGHESILLIGALQVDLILMKIRIS